MIAERRAGRAALAGALTLAALANGCAHHAAAPPPSAPARPVPTAALPQVGDQARAEFDEAVRLLRLGPKHADEARPHLERATELDPGFFEAWHDLGYLDASRGRPAKAAASLQRALDLQPGSRATVLALGEVWRRLGQTKRTAKLYAERLAADPQDNELRARYIQALRESGELTEALAETRLLLGQAGDNDPQIVAAYDSLGLIYYKMGKLALAETALRKALERDAKSAYAWNNLGLVAHARGRDQDAFLDFQRASQLDPKDVQARMNKAVIFLDCGDYQRARGELQRVVDAVPDDLDAQVDAYVALGVAARGLGKWDDARDAYEKALALEPEHAPALYDLGVLSMDFAKAPGKAQGYLSQYVGLADPADPRRADAEARLKELAKTPNDSSGGASK